MAKLILKGIERQPRYVGSNEEGESGSFYILVEAPMARTMGLTKESVLVTDLYMSEKHDGFYVASYVKDEKKGKK